MIGKLNYTAEDGVLIEADVNGEHKEILFSDIEKYWNYATEEDFELGWAFVYGDCIAFSFLVASGQGGVIVLWDAVKECVTHISAADYCQAFCIHKDTIYYLCDITNFVTPSHIALYAVPLNTMDAHDGGERIYCQTPCIIYDRERTYENIDVKASDDGITVTVDGREIVYSDTLDADALSTRNETYSWLYDVFTEDPSTHEFSEAGGMKIDMDKYKVFGWLT